MTLDIPEFGSLGAIAEYRFFNRTPDVQDRIVVADFHVGDLADASVKGPGVKFENTASDFVLDVVGGPFFNDTVGDEASDIFVAECAGGGSPGGDSRVLAAVVVHLKAAFDPETIGCQVNQRHIDQ